jgi:hypothetical protein
MRLKRNIAAAVMAATSLAALCRAQSPESPPVRIDVNEQSQKSQAGGDVVPPNVTPYGYSLDEMASLLAQFSVSGNTIAVPATPFQILYTNPKKTVTKTILKCPSPPGGSGNLTLGINSFKVKPGTPFFVPVQGFDDSPPFVVNFPTYKSQVPDYIFGPNGYGGRDFRIIVDGDKTSLGPAFLGGPVTTAPLPDGGGTHYIQLGVFLTPMSLGIHTVTIQGEVASPNFLAAFGIGCAAEDITYIVAVLP